MVSPRRRPRLLLCLLTVSCLVTAAVVVAGLVVEPPRERSATGEAGAAALEATGARPAPAPARPDVQAAAVLHAWDLRRARAWADGDVSGLRALYVPGAVVGERDAEMLRAWLHRGLRVRGMSTQLLQVDVRDRTHDRLVLAVTDRVSGVAQTSAGESAALPGDRPSRRVVVLLRAGGRWRVAAVREAPG